MKGRAPLRSRDPFGDLDSSVSHGAPAPVAQLVRATIPKIAGCGFESRQVLKCMNRAAEHG